VEEKILELSINNPMWGCVRLSNQLRLIGVSVSRPTIQMILIKHGMGSKYQRLLKLDELALNKEIELTPAQRRGILRVQSLGSFLVRTPSMIGDLRSMRSLLTMGENFAEENIIPMASPGISQPRKKSV